MTDKEHRDFYIAAAVGGLGLIILLLYLFGGQNYIAPPVTDTQSSIPNLASLPPPDMTDYNYNIAPYSPFPPIKYVGGNIVNNPGGGGTISGPPGGPGSGNGCCSSCGPSGQQNSNMTTAIFQTLIG